MSLTYAQIKEKYPRSEIVPALKSSGFDFSECAIDRAITLYKHKYKEPPHYIDYNVDGRNIGVLLSSVPPSNWQYCSIDKDLKRGAWYIYMANKDFTKSLIVYSEEA